MIQFYILHLANYWISLTLCMKKLVLLLSPSSAKQGRRRLSAQIKFFFFVCSTLVAAATATNRHYEGDLPDVFRFQLCSGARSGAAVGDITSCRIRIWNYKLLPRDKRLPPHPYMELQNYCC